MSALRLFLATAGSLKVLSGVAAHTWASAGDQSTTSRAIFVRSGAVRVPITCPATYIGGCTATVTLTATERRRHGRVVAVSATKRTLRIGRARVTLQSGETETVKLKLNAVGQRLRRAQPRFKAIVQIKRTGRPAPTPSQTPAASPTVDPTCDPASQTKTLPAGEPGFTGIVGGITLIGGPAPGCHPVPREWLQGEVTVADAITGAAVATASEGHDQTFTLTLAPGTYTVTGSPTGPDLGTPLSCRGFTQGPASSTIITVAVGQTTPVVVACDVP